MAKYIPTPKERELMTMPHDYEPEDLIPLSVRAARPEEKHDRELYDSRIDMELAKIRVWAMKFEASMAKTFARSGRKLSTRAGVGTKATSIDQMRIRSDYREGETVRALAERYNLSKSSIHRIVAGVERNEDPFA